jgi:hypothetical protein
MDTHVWLAMRLMDAIRDSSILECSEILDICS